MALKHHKRHSAWQPPTLSNPTSGNAFMHNACEPGESLGEQENKCNIIAALDALHDAPNPADLIDQVCKAVEPGGVRLLAAVDLMPTLHDSAMKNNKALTMLLTKNGAGLGTLGFAVSVAKKMLQEGGFQTAEALLEKANTRWFIVS